MPPNRVEKTPKDALNYTKNSIGYGGHPETMKVWFFVCMLAI